MPEKIHFDNELAILKAIKLHFPETTKTTCLFHIKQSWNKYLNNLGLKNRSTVLNSYIKTIYGLLFCNQSCPVQYDLSMKLLTTLEECCELFLVEHEALNFKKFLFYIKNSYFKPNHNFFLGNISNFHIDLLTEVTPQLTNNPCECLNAVLQNKYSLGHVNYSSMVAGIHDFFFERRNKFRIFKAGLKIAKRKKSDLNRFIKLQFIARELRVAVYQSTNNYIYMQDIFYEAAFKFSRTDEDCETLYSQECPGVIPQISIPILY